MKRIDKIKKYIRNEQDKWATQKYGTINYRQGGVDALELVLKAIDEMEKDTASKQR